MTEGGQGHETDKDLCTWHVPVPVLGMRLQWNNAIGCRRNSETSLEVSGFICES